jgi:CPA1 family monovalent cation:H+ antiporter
MVLLIPEDLALAGWSLAYSPREFIMGLTIGCIFTTLFLKATTIKPLAHKLHTDELTETEQLQLGEATALVHAHALERLTKFREKGYVDVSIIDKLSAEHTARLDTAVATCGSHLEDKAEVGERVLRLYALGVEKNRLADLYEYGEVSENVYRKIHGKLSLQYERIEHGSMEDDPAPSAATHTLLRLFNSIMPNREHPVAEHYTYYRTLVVLSRAALREVRALHSERSVRLFGADAIKHITSIYEQFVEGATAKLRTLEADEPGICKTLSERFVRRSILEVESRTLHELYEREMITPKVYLSIKASIDKDADTLAADDEK